MNLFKFIALSSLVFSFACTPDPLQGFEADASGNNGKTDMTGTEPDTSTKDDMGNSGEASAEFIVVANAFRAKCAQVTCHGASAGNSLKVVQSAEATDREVFDALMTETLSVDGEPFILAGNSAGSNYSIRMSRDATDPGFMPIGVAKDQTELDAINAWIDAGATFN